jgi:hypothetical protein
MSDIEQAIEDATMALKDIAAACCIGILKHKCRTGTTNIPPPIPNRPPMSPIINPNGISGQNSIYIRRWENA